MYIAMVVGIHKTKEMYSVKTYVSFTCPVWGKYETKTGEGFLFIFGTVRFLFVFFFKVFCSRPKVYTNSRSQPMNVHESFWKSWTLKSNVKSCGWVGKVLVYQRQSVVKIVTPQIISILLPFWLNARKTEACCLQNEPTSFTYMGPVNMDINFTPLGEWVWCYCIF